MATTSSATHRRQNLADFRVTMDGKDLTDRLRPRLISLRLTEKRGGEADELELVLDDSDGKLAIPRKGVVITCALGWRRGTDVIAGLVDKGRFTVDDASWDSAPDTITVRARSADLTAGYRVRREASHRDTTLGAVAQRVAAAHGYTAHVDPALAGIAVPVLVQDGKSDMALIRDVGRRHDAVATVKDRRLILKPIGKATTSSGAAIPHATILRSAGDRASWKTSERDAYTKVEARWHDGGAAERKTVSHAVAGSADGGDGKVRRLKRTFHSKADADAAAQAEAGRVARAGAELTLSLALGCPDLYPDRRLTVTGFKKGVDGADWLVAEVTHNLDGQGGLRTDLKLETAG
jgi:phage protein D